VTNEWVPHAHVRSKRRFSEARGAAAEQQIARHFSENFCAPERSLGAQAEDDCVKLTESEGDAIAGTHVLRLADD